jgi:hypothetical protein
VENVIAVEVRLADGASRFFLTWGRIQDPVDSAAVCEVVMQAAQAVSLGGEPVAAEVCTTLRDAAEASAPYFYEGLLAFASTQIPFGDGYEAWRKERADAMAQGKEIYYCGTPVRRSEG